ncbi:hypothetical protein C3F09_07000 [candidate division GN15 bacterium]|uniref:Outer membrane protein beta-barrel domain-containing protein n=1 Tax=candidate division GN15 bacterium TaxID=2072418 RepID=A0A855X1C8_9BACT|nr:MAG: hypothetical protein C3F09_07000 [candidate division GN15 bacterium]
MHGHRKGQLLITAIVAITIILCFEVTPLLAAQKIKPTNGDPDAQSLANTHKLSLSFGGLLMSGRVTTAVLPTTLGDYGDMNPIESPFGFGVSFDYNVTPKMRLFIDGNAYSYRKQVGVAGENSESFWVYEMTDYETHYLHFDDDAFFDMRTAGFRLGVKYDLPRGNMRPWFGMGVGVYSWKADYCTADRTKSWGSATGTTFGPTFLCGVDFMFARSSRHPFMLSVYGDFASPVVKPVIDNLFIDGWTWDNSGGNHVMGPYRFGVSLGIFQ